MVQVIHGGENQEKLEMILSAAQKRFGIHGLEKTTMKEIADDLGNSKASLYYYFPDKIELFRAVISREQDEFISLLEENFNRINDPDEMLKDYIRVRTVHFRNFINLSKLRYDAFRNLKPSLKDLYQSLSSLETGIIEKTLESGKSTGKYFHNNSRETAALFLDITQSLRWLVINRKNLETLDSSDFNEMELKMNLFLNLFLKGIRNPI